jgi:hypothetical protein
MLIAGVSTLVFNGNPLLRFDAYFILSDLIEIPNLGTRATRFYAYLVNRYAFGLLGQTTPVRASGEATWFALYGATSYVYRIWLMLSIALLLLAVQLPYGTITQGVVWAPAGADLRAGAEGTLAGLLAPPGASLPAAAPVARFSDPALDARLALLRARIHQVDCATPPQLRTTASRRRCCCGKKPISSPNSTR